MLELIDIAKTHPGGQPLFTALSLILVAGEFVAIMGGSGVGKSTLLNLVAGLDGGDQTDPVSQSLSDYLMSCERDYLRVALDRHEWHMTHTAEALGITRKTLWEKMRRLDIQEE